MRGWGNRLSKINGITVFPLDPEFMPSSYKKKNPRELAKKLSHYCWHQNRGTFNLFQLKSYDPVAWGKGY